jgi:hypothetical protein
MANGPKYPNVSVNLTNGSGNVYAILGEVKKALERAGLRAEAKAFVVEAKATGSYNGVIQTAMRWVDVN